MSFDNSAPAGSLNAQHRGRCALARTATRSRPRSSHQCAFVQRSAVSRDVDRPDAHSGRSGPKPLELAQANFRAYALGWGVQRLSRSADALRTGGVLGSVALVVIVPGKDVAFAILTNSEETVARCRPSSIDCWIITSACRAPTGSVQSQA